MNFLQRYREIQANGKKLPLTLNGIFRHLAGAHKLPALPKPMSTGGFYRLHVSPCMQSYQYFSKKLEVGRQSFVLALKHTASSQIVIERPTNKLNIAIPNPHDGTFISHSQRPHMYLYKAHIVEATAPHPGSVPSSVGAPTSGRALSPTGGRAPSPGCPRRRRCSG